MSIQPNDSKQFIKPFTGLDTQQPQEKGGGLSIAADTKVASENFGAQLSTQYTPVAGRPYENYLRRKQAIVNIHKSIDNANASAKDGSFIMRDDALASAAEGMGYQDQEVNALFAEENVHKQNDAKIAHDQNLWNEKVEVRQKQHIMVQHILPPVLGVGAGFTTWHMTKKVGPTIIVAGLVWAVSARFSGALAGTMQTIHETQAASVLSSGAQVLGMARRVAV